MDSSNQKTRRRKEVLLRYGLTGCACRMLQYSITKKIRRADLKALLSAIHRFCDREIALNFAVF